MSRKISAQLWSVRDYMDKDFVGTLKAIAEMGYNGVEFAGYGDLSAKEMKKILDDFGLDGVSSHIGMDKLEGNLDAEIEYLNTIGAKFIVCPSGPIKDVESAKSTAELLTKIGEKCYQGGLTLGYHNHAYEFTPDNGQIPMEVFFENVDGRYVKQQPDVYWVAYAGVDVKEYMKIHAARCPIIHLKQLENMDTKENVNAGSGIIDFKFISDVCPQAELVYEQEHYRDTSMAEMKSSLEALRKAGI